MACKDCKFWDDDEDGTEIGICHYSAPLVRLCFDETSSDDGNPEREDICYYKAEWPYTVSKDWCSKFTNRKQK